MNIIFVLLLVILYSINIECRPVIDRPLMGGPLEVEKEMEAAEQKMNAA